METLETLPKARIVQLYLDISTLEKKHREKAANSEPNSEEWLVAVAKADAYSVASDELYYAIYKPRLSL
jgi:hypothetical protein